MLYQTSNIRYKQSFYNLNKIIILTRTMLFMVLLFAIIDLGDNMEKKEAKELLEDYIKFLGRNVPNYSQIMSKTINIKWDCCRLSCSNDCFDICLSISKKQ